MTTAAVAYCGKGQENAFKVIEVEVSGAELMGHTCID